MAFLRTPWDAVLLPVSSVPSRGAWIPPLQAPALKAQPSPPTCAAFAQAPLPSVGTCLVPGSCVWAPDGLRPRSHPWAPAWSLAPVSGLLMGSGPAPIHGHLPGPWLLRLFQMGLKSLQLLEQVLGESPGRKWGSPVTPCTCPTPCPELPTCQQEGQQIICRTLGGSCGELGGCSPHTVSPAPPHRGSELC